MGIEFEQDKWLRVQTDSAASARKFFGVEASRPVRFVGFSEDPQHPGRIFEVKADGKRERMTRPRS